MKTSAKEIAQSGDIGDVYLIDFVLLLLGKCLEKFGLLFPKSFLIYFKIVNLLF